MAYILSIDQGTTGTTVSLVNSLGEIAFSANQDFEQIYPQPGWVEHKPSDIWGTVESCTKEVLVKSRIPTSEIKGIGITNQRETVIVWDRKTSQPVYNAIVWQCRRTTEFCKKLIKYKTKIKSKTGLVIDPYFSASKIRWIIDNNNSLKPKIKKKELAAGTIDTFLIWNLSGGKAHVTDASNASRTQLMNIRQGKWDKDLLKIFGVDASLLPDIRESSGILAHTKGLGFLPDGIPVSGVAGDQQAALFGQVCFGIGEAKCTFGTGSFMLMNTGNKMVLSKSGLLTTVAWKLGKNLTYALEGSVFVCGASVQWLRDNLKFIEKSSEVEELAKQVDDTGGVEFVPALTGLGAPYWDPEARGLICGLTRGTTRAHIARATLEAMALQNSDVLIAMQKDLKKKLKKLKVDGGAAENNLLMQIQSDYLNVETIRPSNVETTSLGAAYLAGLGVGLWKDMEEIQQIWKEDKKFTPKIKDKDRKERFKKWHRAISRTIERT
ncbi:MAG: glycerol kinase GlpK [Bdellovibrionota bacterium]